MTIKAGILVLTTAFATPAFANQDAGAPHVGEMTMEGISSAPFSSLRPKARPTTQTPESEMVRPQPRPSN